MAEQKIFVDYDLNKNKILNARMHPITTVDRVALGNTLNSADAGLIVYDLDLNLIYVWKGDGWVTTISNIQHIVGGQALTSSIIDGVVTLDVNVDGSTIEVVNDAIQVKTTKQTEWDSAYSSRIVGVNGPLVFVDGQLGINQAGGASSGFLWEVDYVNFNNAANYRITSGSVTGTTTKTLTLNRQNAPALQISWTDDNTDAVLSVNGLTGAVVLNTDNISEGLTNQYFTTARARQAISLTTNGTSGQATYVNGVFNIPNYTTDLTGYATETYVNTQVLNLINAAPTTLDTLNELAIALGNDPNFATSISTVIGTKADDSAVVHITGTETITGTKTFADLYATNIYAKTPNGNLLVALGKDIAGNGILKLFNPYTSFSGDLKSYNVTADRTWVLPNASGTIALTSNLTAYVTLATQQTITGRKTFDEWVTTNSKLLLNGSGATFAYTKPDGSTEIYADPNSSSFNIFKNGLYNSIYMVDGDTGNNITLQWNNTKQSQVFRFPAIEPNVQATIALVSDIPTLSGLGGVPTSRTLTVNGITYDLSADRSWTISGLLPTGGTAGQILSKVDSTDYNAQWINEAPAASYTSQLKHVVKADVAINKGQAVYVSSADGTNMIVSKASNASEGTSSKTLGLLETSVSANGFANVITEGLLSGLDTTGANAEGDPVWLGTDGNLIYGLANKPYAPNHLVFIGVVTRRNANNGEIFVKVQNGFEMDELHNVSAQNPNHNAILAYNTSTSLWEKNTITGVLGYIPYDSTNPAAYISGITSGMITSALGYTAANDSNVVHKSGAETINGVKTFNSPIVASGEVTITNSGITGCTGVGYFVLNSNSGYSNTAFGYAALSGGSTGNRNTGIGHLALVALTSGFDNTVIGSGAGRDIVTGSYNTIVGQYNGTSGMSSNVILADGQGNIRFQWDGSNIKLNGNTVGSMAYASTSSYIPYTGATSDVNLGFRSLTSSNISIDGYSWGDGGAVDFKQFSSLSLKGDGYTSIGANGTNIFTFGFNQGGYNTKGFKFDVVGLTTNVWRTYTMPNASGTLALTTDIPSLSGYVTLANAQTITGIKTFTNEQLFGNGITLTGGYITYTSGSNNLTLNTNLLTDNRNVFLQDKSGTIALTSDLNNITSQLSVGYLPKYNAITGFTGLYNSIINNVGNYIGINVSNPTSDFEVHSSPGSGWYEIYYEIAKDTNDDGIMYDTKRFYSYDNRTYTIYKETSVYGVMDIFYHPSSGYANKNGGSTYIMHFDTGYDDATLQTTKFQLNGTYKLSMYENGHVAIGPDGFYGDGSITTLYPAKLRGPEAGQWASDMLGGHLYLQGGRSKGTGTPGDVIIQTGQTSSTSGLTLNAAVDRLIIKAGTGNVGIGTSLPVVALQVGSGTVSSIPSWMRIMTADTTQTGIGAVYNNKAIYIYNNGSTLKLDAYDYSAGSALDFQIGGNGGSVTIAPSGGNVLIGTTTNGGPKIAAEGQASGWGYTFYNASGGASVKTYISHGGAYGMAIDSSMNTAGVYLLKLASGDGTNRGTVEQFKVTGAGNVLIGGGSDAQAWMNRGLKIEGSRPSIDLVNNGGGTLNTMRWYGGSTGKELHMNFDTSTSIWALRFNSYYLSGGAASHEFYGNGNLTIAGVFTESSSIRYKNNIQTVQNGLNSILSLRGVSYTKKETGVSELGLIAEEVESVLPDVVIKDAEGKPDSVAYARIVAVLVEAVKELKQEINVLNGKLNS